MGFPGQEYWSGLPCPPSGDLPHPGIKSMSLTSPALAGGFFTTSATDHELLTAKSRLKLKKVWKSTGPFRYDLNQSLYDYTVKVMNRFRGLDLVDKVPEELWMEVCNIVQRAVTKTIPKKKTRRQSGYLRRPYI